MEHVRKKPLNRSPLVRAVYLLCDTKKLIGEDDALGCYLIDVAIQHLCQSLKSDETVSVANDPFVQTSAAQISLTTDTAAPRSGIGASRYVQAADRQTVS